MSLYVYVNCIRHCKTTLRPSESDTLTAETGIPSAGPTVGEIGVGTSTLSIPTSFVLFHNALVLSHGAAFNADDIGVIGIPVTDGICQKRIGL